MPRQLILKVKISTKTGELSDLELFNGATVSQNGVICYLGLEIAQMTPYFDNAAKTWKIKFSLINNQIIKRIVDPWTIQNVFFENLRVYEVYADDLKD